MQQLDRGLVYSASDLNDYLECRHLAWLSRERALRHLAPPEPNADAPDGRDGARTLQTQRELLARKGDEHERRYLERLRADGYAVEDLAAPNDDLSTDEGIVEATQRTADAIARGPKYIYQPTFSDGTFLGRADFLRRIERPCAARAWSYEAIDTKLARSAKPYFLVQLAAYSTHIAGLQGGSVPEQMHVVLGSGEERAFATRDYLAYYRHLRAAFLTHIAGADADDPPYPLSCAHCAVCLWNERCERTRRDDDHLSLVASMRRDQIVKLASAGITTLATLARSAAQDRPRNLSEQTFGALQLQASLQLAQREATAAGLAPDQRYRYRLLPYEAERGLALLPQPAPGDLYFDIEGDPLYAADGGLEYLFGFYAPDDATYHAFWATSGADERRALRQALDFVLERRRRYPDMHVYHYADYEKAALGRLTMRYATHRDELDTLLRERVFVDLYTVVRQSLRISQESYSIKKLEAFYGFERRTALRRGDDSILLFESWLDDGDPSTLDEIRDYNDDDCRSTHALHGWLLERRNELIAREAIDLPWRAAGTVEAEKLDVIERRAAMLHLREAILRGDDPVRPGTNLTGEGAPSDFAAFAKLPARDRLRWLIGNAVDYHYNEAKPQWWRYHERRENLDTLLEFDHDALAGLQPDATVQPYQEKQSRVYGYTFPEQQHSFRVGIAGKDPVTQASLTVVAIDDAARTVRIKSTNDDALANLQAIIPGTPISAQPLQSALVALGQAFLEPTFETQHPAIVDVLLNRPPRLKDRGPDALIQPEVVSGETLAATIAQLDGSYLLVQGPPGSGKSSIGGEAIARLLGQGVRVGILARSHKVAHNLVGAVERAADRLGISFRGAHKTSGGVDAYQSPLPEPFVRDESSAPRALDASHQLVSGTPWLFASPAAVGRFDLLVVDEAGQLALADAMACARAAHNFVFLGDPLQLGAIAQGSHPPGIGGSVLASLLGDRATVAPQRGIFLPRSWRMHPEICAFISDAVYEGRLQSAEGNEANAIDAPGLCGSGLRQIPIEHAGNRRSSLEEAQAIAREVALLRSGRVAVRGKGSNDIGDADILIVTPYNAQRALIEQCLANAGFANVRVGTVDKFQGQEAPVVFYSMATSSGDDLPRDLAFLFEKNRFNVAISRAQCLSVVVYSPHLLEARTRTPEQMALVNLLCEYVERAS